ncbi:MAG: hypothetical protein VB143_01960 [Burkholderia sp.]
MLRWLIAILLVANPVALTAVQGLFGPPPAAGTREPWHLTQQGRPQALHTTAVAQAAEQPVVGGPISSPPIESQPLGASALSAAASPAHLARLEPLAPLAPLAAATLAVTPAALAEGRRRARGRRPAASAASQAARLNAPRDPRCRPRSRSRRRFSSTGRI